jgi:hypothetical protein
MSDNGEVFIISIPLGMTERVTPLLPTGFTRTGGAGSIPDFRFGVSEFSEYIGPAKDAAQFIAALVGILAAVRGAGGRSIGVRRASDAEPVEIGVDATEPDIN